MATWPKGSCSGGLVDPLLLAEVDIAPVEWASSTPATDAQRAQLKALSRRLPKALVETMWLCMSGVAQGEVAERLGIAQPSVSLRVGRAVELLRYWRKGPPALLELELEDVARATGSVAAALYWDRPSNAAVGRWAGMTPSGVRSRVTRAGRKVGGDLGRALAYLQEGPTPIYHHELDRPARAGVLAP